MHLALTSSHHPTLTVGVDVVGIAEQLREHDRRATARAAADAAELERLRAIAAAAEAIEQAASRSKQGALRDLSSTWAQQRDLTRGREWDLNDPLSTYKSTLPRNTAPVWATREFAPVSGLQVFDAELLEDPAIPAAKRAELVANLEAGVAEEARRRANDATAARAEAVRAETMRRLADDAAAAEAASAAASRALTRRDNEALAAAAAGAAAERQAAAAAAESRQVDAVLSDPMLREDTRTSVNVSNPLRFRPDHFRGLSAAQREGIRETQLAQAEAAADQRARDAQQRRDEEARALAYDGAAVAMQAEAERVRSSEVRRRRGRGGGTRRESRAHPPLPLPCRWAAAGAALLCGACAHG